MNRPEDTINPCKVRGYGRYTHGATSDAGVWLRNRLVFSLKVDQYEPQQRLVWRKVEPGGNERSREVLTIISQNELKGHGHNNPDHKLHYERLS